jgi:RNA polymerase sigma-70 factor (ECF subfamily)
MNPNETAARCEAFEALQRTHQPRLYAIAYRLTGNADDAQDLLQQSLLEAYAAFDRFAPGTRFDRWVGRIMRNSFLDSVRRRPRFTVLSLDVPFDETEGESGGHDVADSRRGPESELLEGILAEPLQRALEALPAEFRTVVELVDMQEESYEGVARRLACPIGTVRSRLHRARSMMRRALGDSPRNVFARAV